MMTCGRVSHRLLLPLLAALAMAGAKAESARHWIGSWAASPTNLVGFAAIAEPYPFVDTTFRTYVRLSAGGSALRLRLSNELGGEPLSIGAVHVARSQGGRIVPGTDRTVTFQSAPTALIAQGSALVSDAVELPVDGLAELAISIHVPGPVDRLTAHGLGHNWTWMSTTDETGKAEQTAPLPAFVRYIVSGVEVASPSAQAATLAVLGDSITDGALSTFNANRRWPDALAERLQGAGMRDIGVVNQGISGNRLLSAGAGISAIARLDRDVFSQPGLRAVVLLAGINDLGMPIAEGKPIPPLADMIAAYTQIASRVHERGIRLIAATLLPYGKSGPGYYSAEGDQVRRDVNAWIRTTTLFDAVLDLDKLTADPGAPSRLAPLFDSGDGIHPADAGYRAIAESIDLERLSACVRLDRQRADRCPGMH